MTSSRFVYAPVLPTGKGNDVSATEGWSCVNSGSLSVTIAPSYAHVYGGNMIDQNNKNWGSNWKRRLLRKADGRCSNARTRWLQRDELQGCHLDGGTDSDCQNMSGLEVGEGSPTFDVTVSLVGIVPDSK